MTSSATPDDFSHLQDVFGSLPMLKTYILLCLFFPVEQPVSVPDLGSDLGQGLDQLAAAFPFLKGQVIYEGVGEGNTGSRNIIPLDDHIHFTTNDLKESDDFPSMAELSAAKFPFSMLDDRILASGTRMPKFFEGLQSYEDSSQLPAPVFVVQANIIRGGIVLWFAGNHTVMDANGLGQIICFLAKSLRKESFTDDEIQQGNQSRNEVVPLFDHEYRPGPEANDFMVSWPREPLPDRTGGDSPAVWAYFNFSVTSQKHLKQSASKQIDGIAPYISTNDVITALLWQHIAKARALRLGPQTSTKVSRQVSARKYLGISEGYLGQMVGSSFERELDVWERPLGEIAARLRRDLMDTHRISHATRSMATMLSRTLDKSQVCYGTSLNFDRDVVVSSWSELECCRVEFGPVLGIPEAARRPLVAAFPSVNFMMPTSRNGDLAVAVCLREDDMRRFREDVELAKYAEYLG